MKLKLDFEHCYGIRKLIHELNFGSRNAIAIYAPNGSMKSSFAKTFADLAAGRPTTDRFFKARVSKREVTKEDNSALQADEVYVVHPYDEVFDSSSRTSTLLVNPKLRKEYEELHKELEKATETFIDALKKQSGVKKNLEAEVSQTFTSTDNSFYRALVRIKDEVAEQKTAPFADVKYATIFDSAVLKFLSTDGAKAALEAYITRYNEVIAASTYFKKGIFNYHNAGTIAKNLADNGFFKANHSLKLNAANNKEISTAKELEELIDAEKQSILNDPALAAHLQQIDELINDNKSLREFGRYISERGDVLAQLSNVQAFRQELWKSYIHKNGELYEEVVRRYQDSEIRRKEIEAEARKERSQWQEVIDIFNSRFSVPFKVEVQNFIEATLSEEPPQLGFAFEDGAESVAVNRDELLKSLSTGERRAFYILNIIFEIEVKKKAGVVTVLIVDDIADSFDYKNKYAIVQYLKEIGESGLFKQVILTHNFDFLRTIQGRVVNYNQCLMTTKGAAGITLNQSDGIKNIFVKKWKTSFFNEPKQRIACIPFMRNLIEFTRGEADPVYSQLTSLLHQKANSAAIDQAQLDIIYNTLFGGNGAWANQNQNVIEFIKQQADGCLTAPEGVNFENKVVLSIAIRLVAEDYMIRRIANAAWVGQIQGDQTATLVKKFKEQYPTEYDNIKTLQCVALMTPENIHLNSFMYEPILDMSDAHLRKLYVETKALV